MTLETALQIAYVVTLLAFGLRDWQMRRRVRTLSGRVRALLDLEHERQDERLSRQAVMSGFAHDGARILKAPLPSYWSQTPPAPWPDFRRYP